MGFMPSKIWTQQPQSQVLPAVASDHLYNFAVSGRGSRGVDLTLTANGSLSQFGLYGNGSGYAASIGGNTTTALDPRTGDFTIVFVFRLTTIPGTGINAYVVASDQGFNSTNYWWTFVRGDGAGNFSVRGFAATASGYNHKAGELVTVVHQRVSGVVTTYIKGVRSYEVYTAADTVDYYNRLTSSPITVMGPASTGGGYTNANGTALLFDMSLGRQWDAKSLVNNPWQIFQPLNRNIFASVSGGASNGTGSGSLSTITLASVSAGASGSSMASGAVASSSLSAPSVSATGTAVATGALTAVTLTTISASAVGSALASGSLDAIDLSSVSGSATGTTAGNAVGVGSVSTIALSSPLASASGTASASGSLPTISLSTVAGSASSATHGSASASVQSISISAPLAIAIASSVASGGVQSIGITAPNGSASGQVQTVAHPASDTSNAGWVPSTGTDLYAMIDETTMDNSDYVSAAAAGAVYVFKLSAASGLGATQKLQCAAWSSTGNGVEFKLYQGNPNTGGTLILTWTPVLATSAPSVPLEYSLTSGEIAAISDYSNLYIKQTSI